MRKLKIDFGKQEYVCQFPWPSNCWVQGDNDGIVLTDVSIEEAITNPQTAQDVLTRKVAHYSTAFFEAFPKDPSTFIRGEGSTLEEAEAACWKQLRTIQACPQHEFERKGRKDGYVYCKKCALSGLFFDPLHPCSGCNKTQYKYYGSDKNDRGFCQTCYEKLSDDQLTDSALYVRKSLARFKAYASKVL